MGSFVVAILQVLEQSPKSCGVRRLVISIFVLMHDYFHLSSQHHRENVDLNGTECCNHMCDEVDCTPEMCHRRQL